MNVGFGAQDLPCSHDTRLLSDVQLSCDAAKARPGQAGQSAHRRIRPWKFILHKNNS